MVSISAASTTLGISLSALDVGFFVLTLSISVLIGIYFTNKNNTIEEYMLGGRDQSLLPVSMSMMTSFVSGLSLVGYPAELYHHGISFSLVIMAMILSVPFSAFILMPVFYRLGSISTFNYLEHRYSPTIKRTVSLLFMLQMTLYNAVVLYVPSLSLQSVLGVSSVISIGAVGASSIFYCTLGGIKAVIWTDFFQAGIMYLSLLVICVFGTIEAGGIARLIEIGQSGNRLSLDKFFMFDLTTRHTVFTITTGAVIVNIFMNGANQIQVQRALSLPSLRLAQWSQLLTALFTVLISLISSYIGLILFENYQKCDPYNNGQIDKRDAILIYYVGSHLNYLPGLRGCFVAGLFAATLSTLSSFQNSMSALVLEDFIKPNLRQPMSEKWSTYLSKLIALLFGLACITLTFVVGNISGLLQVAYTLFGSLGAPFTAAFFMGMLTRFTNTTGMLIGMLSGFALGIYVQLYQTFYLPPLEPTLPLSTMGCNALILNASTISSPLQMSSHFAEQINNQDFSIGNMSYLWLPVLELILTIVISTLVSLLTGGWKQQVEDKYLVGWLHKGDQTSYKNQKEQLMGQMRAYTNGLKDETRIELELEKRECGAGS